MNSVEIIPKDENGSGFDRLGDRCKAEFLKLEKLTKEAADLIGFLESTRGSSDGKAD